MHLLCSAHVACLRLINPYGVQLLGGDTARLLATAEMMDADLVRILGSQDSQQHVTGEW